MSWRIEKQRRGRGTTYRLRRSVDGKRQTVTIGQVHPDDAERARDALEQIEAAGLGETWHDWHRRQQDAAVEVLRHTDPINETRRLGKDHSAMKLRTYWETEYRGPREQATRGWAQEARHWPRILEEIGDVRLRHIDEWVVADYLDALVVRRGKRAGLPMSGNSKRIHRALLKALLVHAYRHKHIRRIPDLAVFRIKGSTKRVRQEVEPLTADEVRRLLAAASSTRDRGLFATAIGQGLRPSELVRMRWEDIDWQIPAMDVRGSKTEASEATIPITPIAHPHLRAHWMAEGQPAEGFVWVTRSGQPYASPVGWRKALETALRKAGITRHFTPYNCRHSFATLAWSAGIPKEIARRILRHTDDRMLDKVYARPSPADLAARVAGFTL